MCLLFARLWRAYAVVMSSSRHHNAAQRLARIEVHVEVIEQLFDSIDPSPFLVRDLDPDADNYIVASSKALPQNAELALVVHLDRLPVPDTRLQQVEPAIRTHFSARAASVRLQLRELFGRGRISLLIGLVCLSASIAAVEYSAAWLPPGAAHDIVRESLLIGGWVAMWRPMEVFLYDWWPMAAELRLLRRLARITVQVLHRPLRLGHSEPRNTPD